MPAARPLLIIAGLAGAAFLGHSALERSAPVPTAPTSATPSAFVGAGASAAPSDALVSRGVDDSGDGPLARRPDLEARVAALEAAVAGLQNRLRQLPAASSAAPAAAGPGAARGGSAADTEDDGVHPPPALLAQQQAEAAEAARLRVDLVERRFASQAVDRAWATRASAAIQDALRTEGPQDSAVLSAECRSTLCRIELQQDDPQALDAASSALMGALGDQVSRMMVDYGEGEGATTVLYLVRHGYALP